MRKLRLVHDVIVSFVTLKIDDDQQPPWRQQNASFLNNYGDDNDRTTSLTTIDPMRQ